MFRLRQSLHLSELLMERFYRLEPLEKPKPPVSRPCNDSHDKMRWEDEGGAPSHQIT